MLPGQNRRRKLSRTNLDQKDACESLDPIAAQTVGMF